MISEKAVEQDYESALKQRGKDGKPLTDFQSFMEVGRLILKLLINIRTNSILPEEEKKRIWEKQQKERAEKDKK